MNVDCADSIRLGATLNGQIRIAVLITCFNRRNVTLRCLEAFSAQSLPECRAEIFVVDDGSSDGTSNAIAGRFPEVRLFAGTGELFWNGGMHMAFGHAMAEDFDYYLWLNDDTVLFTSAISRMLQVAREYQQNGVEAIIVGNTVDPNTNQHSYGGVLKGRGFKPAAFRLVTPNPNHAEACDTMNGNCTLIPRAAVQRIGNLDRRFRHNFGDLDYGLRAKAQGIAIFAAPGFVGECSRNTDAGTWKDQTADLKVRWTRMHSPKGCPWHEWSYFTRRHLGRFWFLSAISPYVMVFLQAIRRSMSL